MSTNNWKLYWEQHVDQALPDRFSQVGRTRNAIPMTEEMFSVIAMHILKLMDIKSDHRVLDFCCGNGLLCSYICKLADQVVGVDFNQKLIKGLEVIESNNVLGVVSDAMEIQFTSMTFDRIVFAAAIQHFTESQIIILFRRFHEWLKPGGKLLISDITNRKAMWQFYDSDERKAKYFNDTSLDSSPLGTWFDKDWLQYLSEFVKFSSVEFYDQPDQYWYSHYRFDMLAMK